MPPIGPYGIEQVDVPGALGVFETARSNRIRQMLLRRQIAAADFELETHRGVRAALGRFTGDPTAPAPAAPGYLAAPSGAPDAAPWGMGRDASPTADPASTGAAGAGGMASAIGRYDEPAADPAALPGAMPQATAPTDPLVGNREALFRSLLALDPAQASEVAQAFDRMDDTQFQASERRNQILGRAAEHLLELPEAERSAEFQRIAPDLIERGGITARQLAGFELTEQNLGHVLSQARDIEKIIESRRADRRLDHDIADDETDNAREGRLADSLIGWRRGQLDQGRDRIDLQRTDPRRHAPTPRAPSPNAVIGEIMAKQARGETLTPSEQRLYEEYRQGRGRERGHGRAGGGNGARAMLNGRVIVPRGNGWVYQDSGEPAR